MADIAILVAEEYERRVKSSSARKAAGFGGGDHDDHHQLETDLESCVSVLAQTLHKKIGQDKMEFAKWIKEPKTLVALAASNGFFSA